jgi:signal transduction histidine kinase
MKKSISLVLTLALIFMISGLCSAEDKAQMARSTVEKAVKMAQEEGLKKTLKAINDLEGPFVKGDLYVFAMSLDNMRLAAGSPFNKKKLGTTANADFNKKMANVAKTEGSGWVEYSWPKPGGDKPTPKRTFIMRVPGEDAYFGCGYYTE